MAPFPHGVPNVAVVPVGDPPQESVQCVSDALERKLGVSTSVFDAQPVPETERDSDWVEAGELLGQTAEPVREEFDLAVGVTDARMKTLDKYDLFGTRSAGGNVATVSTTRVLDGESRDELERRRMGKLALHAVGGLFGFENHRSCVMQSADTVSDIDDRPATFCDECRRRLEDPETAPESPEWHAVTKELEQFRTAKRWAEGEIRLTEYPLFALGWMVDTLSRVRSNLPSTSGLSVPRSLRAFFHESYRTIRFWVLVLTYFATFALVVFAGFLGYETVAGSQPSDAVTWSIVVLGLSTAYVVQLLARGIVGGLVVGVAEGTRKGLSAEE